MKIPLLVPPGGSWPATLDKEVWVLTVVGFLVLGFLVLLVTAFFRSLSMYKDPEDVWYYRAALFAFFMAAVTLVVGNYIVYPLIAGAALVVLWVLYYAVSGAFPKKEKPEEEHEHSE